MTTKTPADRPVTLAGRANKGFRFQVDRNNQNPRPIRDQTLQNRRIPSPVGNRTGLPQRPSIPPDYPRCERRYPLWIREFLRQRIQNTLDRIVLSPREAYIRPGRLKPLVKAPIFSSLTALAFSWASRTASSNVS